MPTVSAAGMLCASCMYVCRSVASVCASGCWSQACDGNGMFSRPHARPSSSSDHTAMMLAPPTPEQKQASITLRALAAPRIRFWTTKWMLSRSVGAHQKMFVVRRQSPAIVSAAVGAATACACAGSSCCCNLLSAHPEEAPPRAARVCAGSAGSVGTPLAPGPWQQLGVEPPACGREACRRASAGRASAAAQRQHPIQPATVSAPKFSALHSSDQTVSLCRGIVFINQAPWYIKNKE